MAITQATGRVLVVDDDSTAVKIHSKVLSSLFEIETADSGLRALDICKALLPDLVLLDVQMPEMNGYETCKKLREFTDIPIIFVTATNSAEEHLQAFDAGGDDVILKPVSFDILLRKVSLAISRKNEQRMISDLLQDVKTEFNSAAGENGVLQTFMRSCLTCVSINDLSTQLVGAIKDLGLVNCVLIRNKAETAMLTSHGEPTSLEISVLEQSAKMGSMFQFKQRLAVNNARVSVIVTNMPADATQHSARLRENLVTLVEITEAMCEYVEMRQDTITHAELMQVALQTTFGETEALDRIRQVAQGDMRLLLQELVDSVENTYSWLGTTNSQEASISKAMYESVDRVLNVLETTREQYDKGFEKILSSLKSNDFGGDVELF
jgi:CheY-like chemotaxis protein